VKKKKLFYGPLGWVGSAGLIIGAGLLAFSFWFLSTTVLKDIGYVRTGFLRFNVRLFDGGNLFDMS